MKRPQLLSELKKLWRTLLKQSLPTKIGAGLLALVAILAIAYLAFSLAYLGKVYPRVSVGGVSFGGLSAEQTKQKLQELADSHAQPIALRYNDESQTLSQEEIDWRYNVEKTAEKIYQIGRDDSDRWGSFRRQITSIFAVQRAQPVVSYDEQALEIAIAAFAAAVDQPAVDASAEYKNDRLVFAKEEVGQIINREEIRDKIIGSWGRFQGDVVAVQTYFAAPTVVLGDTAALKTAADQLSEKRLTLTWDSTTKNLTRNEIRRLIGFVGGEPLPGSGSQRYLTVRFTLEQAKDYLQDLATQIDQPAVEPRLTILNGRLAIASVAKAGRIVDLSESAADIVTALHSAQTTTPVTLTFKSQQPLITEDNLDKLGISERIGLGTTSFAGSPSNRIHNIDNGVSFLQSALIAPGEEFSTVESLGEVDHTTGYLPELVIKENRTVPEYGGGLCQVSTTLFRAVLDAGLPVTERRNHSYRVSYYEPPVGLDATIYLPKPDFRFRNDTKAHILIQGRVVGNNVIFELWGTSDGRTATVSQPQILSTTKPGEPIKVETDTLPKGEEKQIETAHDGAVTIAYYTVKRDGKVINQQTFRSVYKAWPARFLVGTGEAPPEP